MEELCGTKTREIKGTDEWHKKHKKSHRLDVR